MIPPLWDRGTAEDDVPVQVSVSRRIRGPFVRWKRGEPTRLIEGIRISLDFVPKVPGALVTVVLGADTALSTNLWITTSPVGILAVVRTETLASSNAPARRRVVRRIVDILTQMNFSKPHVMICNSHEI